MLNQFMDKETYIHRLDVRTKLVIFLTAITLVFLFNHPFYNLGLVVILLLAIIPSKIPLKNVFNLIKPLLAIFSIIIIMTCFTAQPDQFRMEASKTILFQLFQGGGGTATLGGLLIGLTYLVRIFLMILTTTIFTITTPVDDIIELLQKMRAPYELSIVLTTAISFVPTMVTKKDLIFQAQKARGARISGKGIIGQLKAFVPIMIPLIINSILLANNLAIAMLNRGYGASNSWTSLTDIKMQKTDYLVLAGALGIFAFSLYLRFGLHYGLV